MKHNTTNRHSRKGMAMLMVLFIVMAITIITSAFIARSVSAMASGRNFCVRNEADYAAWGGMEVAWALVQDPNTLATLTFPLTDQLDAASTVYYDLTIGTPAADIYPVESCGYTQVDGQMRACSKLYGKLYYDAVSDKAGYISIRRQE
jgi:hypothetical protein